MKLSFWCFFTQTVATIALLSLAFVLPASGQQAQQPTALELSKKETVASALLRGMEFQEYEVRSAAEAMPEDLYGYRPAEGKFKDQKPDFGPAEVRTFAEQVKHVACSNLAFASELNGDKPPEGCDKAGPDTRLGLASVVIWHNADHYGQMTVYLRLNGIVPPASRPSPPPVKDTYK